MGAQGQRRSCHSCGRRREPLTVVPTAVQKSGGVMFAKPDHFELLFFLTNSLKKNLMCEISFACL